MPNIKSAKKRMELGQKWEARNRHARARLRTAIKRVRQAEDQESAETAFRGAVSLLDRAGRKRLYHPKKVARLKSQLQRHVSQIGAD
jgi:small subunit ribosomal protein S20